MLAMTCRLLLIHVHSTNRILIHQNHLLPRWKALYFAPTRLATDYSIWSHEQGLRVRLRGRNRIAKRRPLMP